ncbi:MAG TPA: tRNA (adenosine(37)-N6)-threonylcarbamoyltransferase complex ATPase subunit type 1 TsaE [Dokdonella sp.]|nr:tRNA (adenosine(37)-N6)-threonylcarbamoyltransferase complex ATPase subunit type 1 TsaE [Dokdonella sp.]
MSDRFEKTGIDENELVAIARKFAGRLDAGGVVFLKGELGAGKTTFARALMSALGVGERIKSPTYSLIESYRSGQQPVHHLDLYRIAHAGELEWLGLPDLLDDRALVLVEWPERASAALPPADLVIELRHAGERRDFSVTAVSAAGLASLQGLRGALAPTVGST